MKRDEKNLLSRQKIIDAAIQEFGTMSYKEASMNNICKRGFVSKGIIYHYFKDKDELYLHCLEQCFEELGNQLIKEKCTSKSFEENIKHYINARNNFFSDNPYFRTIFFNSLLNPPKHLSIKIKELRKDIDRINIEYCKDALEDVLLKPDITYQDAIEYYLILQDSFNTYFQNKVQEEFNFDELVATHEEKIAKMLKILLYGIAKEKN